jgi:hypothetical protein
MMLAMSARKFLFFVFAYLFFLRYSHILPSCYIDRSEEGAKKEPTAHVTAPTSTSNTLVISEEHRTAAETSPPPQQHVEASTPEPSPRAPLAKRAKTGAGSTQGIVAGSTSSPLMDDVSSPLFSLLVFLFCLSNFLSLPMFLHICRVFFL